MENIHNSSRRAWIGKKVIVLKEFLKEFINELSDYTYSKTLAPKYHCFDDMPSQVRRDTEIHCGLASMRCKNQEKVEPAYQFDIPDGMNSITLREQKADLEKRDSDSKYYNALYVAMKHTNYPPHKRLKADINKFKPMPVNLPEVVVTVQIHAPERRLDSKVVNYAKMPSFHADQEFLVLGCQYLTELRKMIDCVSDKAASGEYSDCPYSLPTETCKDIYKSGFFYINGVFYNDMRDKDCRDYSEPIIKWSKNRGIGPFKKALMEETRIIDLTLHLGYPYVYVHQGECEHLIIFTDLRLFSDHDVNHRNAYPMYTQSRLSKRIFCMVCHAYTATWVVYGNDRLPENPYFFCKLCFFSFNYDKNNQKIGEFKAYHFPDRTRLF